jgi:hypothetical protein
MWDKRLKLIYNWTGGVNSFVEHELGDKSDIQRVVFMMGGKCMLTVDSVMYFVHKRQKTT